MSNIQTDVQALTPNQPRSWLKRLSDSTSLKLRRFKRADDGVAAIEFALIAPVMLLIYAGMVEILLLVEADRDVTQAASVVGDLVAQNDILGIDDQTNYINAVLSILGTNADTSTNKVGIEVISYEAEDDGSGGRDFNLIGYSVFGQNYTSDSQSEEVLNSSGHNTVSAIDFDPATISDTLFPNGSGIVVARVNYTYSSPLQYFVQSPKLRETFFFKPRQSTLVPFDSGATHADKASMFCQISHDSATDISQAECDDIYTPEHATPL